MLSFPVILVNSLSVLMICGIIFVAWQKREDTSISQLIVLSVFMLVWAVCSFVEMAVGEINQKILWRNITQIGSFYTPAATLIFSITYSGILYKHRKKLAYFIYSIQTAGILFIFTDQWHHLARNNIFIIKGDAYETLAVNTTILTKVLISFNFLYMAVSLFILIMFTFLTTKSMRKQVLCVILGMSVSIAYSLLKISSNELFGVMVPISGIFALTDLCMLFGIIKYDLLMTAPIARNEVFHIVDDGIVIASTNGKIIDANRAAVQIFNCESGNKSNEAVFGCLEKAINESFPEWYDAMMQSRPDKFNILKTGGEAIKYYLCDVYALKNKKSKTIGSISVIKDITEQKRKNDLLKLSAEKDGLTGIYNRKTFIERVETILKNCNEDICLLFLDIDYFKQINDNYGHACGDYVLKDICRHIQSSLNEETVFGRMGGEEFAIFFKIKDAEKAVQFAEVLRAGIETYEIRFDNRTIHITVSIGIAIGRYMSFNELYRVADLNLYKAKESGRNCTRF